MEKRGDYYYLEYASLSVKWDVDGTWFITLSEPHGTHNVKGLCGNYNKDPHGKWRHFTMVFIHIYTHTYINIGSFGASSPF